MNDEMLTFGKTRGVTRSDGARGKSKFGTPMVQFGVFRKQMHCIQESTCDIVGTFGTTRSHSAPGELCPPRYAPGKDNTESELITFVYERFSNSVHDVFE